MNLQEIINTIYQFAPPSEGEPVNPTTLRDLRSLTVDLIKAYRDGGLLQEDPFEDARCRTIHLHQKEIQNIIGDGTVLVTGGSGCIGTGLINKLLHLGAKKIVSVDRAFPADIPAPQPQFNWIDCDLYDGERLLQIFQSEKPRVVFHLGAQRNPGLAERQIRDTLRTNVIGTANVIRATQECGAAHFVFSSTGKASRYVTSEVYAASKKLAEWQTIRASESNTRTSFSAVRFTHVLDNSLVCDEIARRISAGRPINIHAPQRFIIAQSRMESVNLLLNSLVFSQPQKPLLAAVRNLGWPGETLEHALFQLDRSRKNLPIYFQGLPTGYEEGFFCGQIPWSQIEKIHPLVNVLENHTRSADSSGDTLLVKPAPFDGRLLDEHVEHLTEAVADQTISDAQLKWSNARAVREVALSSFDAAPVDRVLQILRWGTESRRLKKTGDSLTNHSEIINMIGDSLQNRTSADQEKAVGFEPGEVKAILKTTRPAAEEPSLEKFASLAAC